MTDLVEIALIGAVPATLAALAAFVVGILNGQKADKIHVLVNSNLDAVKADLLLAKDEIVNLRAVVTALRRGEYEP